MIGLKQVVDAELAGKTTITPGVGQAATVVFRDLEDIIDRVTAEMDGSKRTSITLNATL